MLPELLPPEEAINRIQEMENNIFHVRLEIHRNDIWNAYVDEQIERGGMHMDSWEHTDPENQNSDSEDPVQPPFDDTDSVEDLDIVELYIDPTPARRIILRMPSGLTEHEQLRTAAARLCLETSYMRVVSARHVEDIEAEARGEMVRYTMRWPFRPHEHVQQEFPTYWTVENLIDALRHTTPLEHFIIRNNGTPLRSSQILRDLPDRDLLIDVGDYQPPRGGVRGAQRAGRGPQRGALARPGEQGAHIRSGEQRAVMNGWALTRCMDYIRSG